LVWKIAQSKQVDKLYAAPGNPGMVELAEIVEIGATDIAGLLKFASSEKIDLTVVGPEEPLASGIVDEFSQSDLRVFGPTKAAAAIESSKSYAKTIMAKYGIPTAEGREFTDVAEAIEYVKSRYVKRNDFPVVIKADGLAAGKGVTVAATYDEAEDAIKRAMVEKAFGRAGDKVIVEEFLEGEEASLLAFSDGVTVIPMIPAQDHKRIYDADVGPNTGGMGAYAPAPVVDGPIMNKVKENTLFPAVTGLAREGRPYRGVLYAGLMITSGEPKVIEFNCRFGDPEAQVILPLLENDLVDIMMACTEGKLDEVKIDASKRAAVCVVIASGGYPLDYERGKVIEGLEKCGSMGDVIVFHAGTKKADGKIVTSGGRVLGVTALGDNLKDAIKRAYQAVGEIGFDRMHYRKDIGHRALGRRVGWRP
jgi:phosphoribosylamine--glycine ligase